MIYFIIISFLLLLVARELESKKRSNKIVRKKQLLNLNYDFIVKFDKFTNNFKILRKIKKKYALLLESINVKGLVHNERIISLVFLGLFSLIIFTFFFTFWFLNVWYISIGYMFLVSGACIFLIHFYLNKKRKKIQNKFPEALQLFLDSYINTKNIKSSIAESYVKMPKEIAPLFEKLARNLATNRDYEEHILNFAKSLNYVWGYAFAQLLIMSFENVGDITEQLIFLNSTIQDDITESADQHSQLGVNKIYFYIVLFFGISMFLGTIIYNPLAYNLYFNSITGKNIILLWSLMMLSAYIVLNMMEDI